MRDAGVPGEIDHETVLSADLARQKIDECLLQSPGAGVFIVEFEDFFESQLVQDLGHGLRVLNGAWDFRRKQIVFDPNDHAPRFVIQSLRLSELGLGRREPETNADENREQA